MNQPHLTKTIATVLPPKQKEHIGGLRPAITSAVRRTKTVVLKMMRVVPLGFFVIALLGCDVRDAPPTESEVGYRTLMYMHNSFGAMLQFSSHKSSLERIDEQVGPWLAVDRELAANLLKEFDGLQGLDEFQTATIAPDTKGAHFIRTSGPDSGFKQYEIPVGRAASIEGLDRWIKAFRSICETTLREAEVGER